MIRFGTFAFLVAAAIGQAVPVMASDSAVVLMYHRFGETAHPSTNIRIEQFEAHLEELSREKYTVLPLPKIIAKLRRASHCPIVRSGSPSTTRLFLSTAKPSPGCSKQDCRSHSLWDRPGRPQTRRIYGLGSDP